ncbi:nodulation-signaling pathway 1 protein-like [Panicum miliaceum]|uniref:Nodulation-signaling pathway 1 protein-like n=1 Tax=Panicum miliaceum TaxID=4540 RepID=A0A3L6T770_PANMI|nr:nodulation-signaling pathway 1 protein-like [Panicum miliaceum]
MSNERGDQEPAAATGSDASDWLDESIAFLAADLDVGLGAYGWLQASAEEQQQGIDSMVAETPPPPVITLPQSSLGPVSTSVASSPAASPREFGQPRKRKSPQHSSQRCPVGGGGGGRGSPELDRGGTSCSRKPSKKGSAKAGAASLGRDARWAEQLLNPCAVAIEAGNLPRAQHLLYVLGELASFSGKPNHRLAAHGLRALTQRLPHAVGLAAAATVKMPSCECPTPVFSGVDPRLFRASLIRFNEVSPWFAVPNALANATIAQAAAAMGAATEPRQIHVVDIGVSHGVQWPTLLEALTRVPRGSTAPSVRLTVGGPAAGPPVPFSSSPPGYDCSPQLLRYAKTINLDLAIVQAPCTDILHGTLTPGETLVVCLQFRLGHATADEQVAVLRNIRILNPELLVLAELDRGGRSDGSAASEFAARLEHLWMFLDSTAAAFKGRDADERRVMEAEAGTALAATARRGAAVDGGREAWRARLAAAGFEEAAFGGEAVETAKALLRKYDGGWELVPPSPSAGAAVGLRWKGQLVSFCSLWRPAQSSPEPIWRGA